MVDYKDFTSVNISKVVGKGYKSFWEYKGRYLVCKGSRGSKKSTTASMKLITNIMRFPLAHGLVIRRYDVTHRDSTYAQLLWAINRLRVSHLWRASLSPMQLIFIPTGQKIFFRGMDDPQSIASITSDFGTICFVWIEEAFQITKEDDFDKLDLSIRGEMPDGYYKQFMLIFNPWNQKSWLKTRFFDTEDQNVLALTTNYLCNEFLGVDDLEVFERMKTNSPRRFAVEGLGDWGITEGIIFENWHEETFDIIDIRRIPGIQSAFGLDFGYTNDPSALWCGMVDLEGKRVFVFDELYEKGLSNEDIYASVVKKGYRKERIFADCAEPKSIDRLRELGMHNIRAARKGRDSVNSGIDFIQDFQIIVHPKCVNFLVEISNYAWVEDRFGKWRNIPIGDFNHLMDAMRYGMEDFIKSRPLTAEVKKLFAEVSLYDSG